MISTILITRVGPSVITVTFKKPDPGLSVWVVTACSIGTPLGKTWGPDGPGNPKTALFPFKINENTYEKIFKLMTVYKYK